MQRPMISALFAFLIQATPAIAQDVAQKPLFIGQWTFAAPDESCGNWPRNLAVAAADTKHIVAGGIDYSVTGLPGHPPRDRENTVITEKIDFQIIGDDQEQLIISFKAGGKVTHQCHYARARGHR
jgi:hypothetical protein